MNAERSSGNLRAVDEFRLQSLLVWVVCTGLFVAFVLLAFPALDTI